MTAWLDFAFWVAVQVAVITTVFETTRRLTLKRLPRRGVYLLVAAVVICAGFGSLFFWLHRTSSDLVALSDQNNFKPLPEDWCKDTTLEVCEKNSKALATSAFMSHGTLMKHVNASGQWVTFQPSQNDISERDKVVAINTQLRDQAVAFARIAWTWWVSLVAALAFGYLTARQQMAANSTAEPDARKGSASGSM